MVYGFTTCKWHDVVYLDQEWHDVVYLDQGANSQVPDSLYYLRPIQNQLNQFVTNGDQGCNWHVPEGRRALGWEEDRC